MLRGLRALETVSREERETEKVKEPKGQGRGETGTLQQVGVGGTLKEETDGHRCPCDPGRGRGHGGEPGPAGTGDGEGGERRQSKRQRKEGRGQATETCAYLRRGFGEGGPGGGRTSRLGLVVDSDLGGGSRGAIRRRGALVPFRRGVVTAEARQERGPDGGRPRRPGRSVRVTGCMHMPMPWGPVCENVLAHCVST